MQQAAGVLVQGMTAHYLACNVYPVKPGYGYGFGSSFCVDGKNASFCIGGSAY